MPDDDRTIREDQDDVWTVLAVGDEVGTPEGPGTVEEIEIALARYIDETELEPPHVQVRLEDGSIIDTCLCRLELQDPDDTEVVRSEFQRLWPPVQDHVPEDAESTLPEEAAARSSDMREFKIEGKLWREVRAASNDWVSTAQDLARELESVGGHTDKVLDFSSGPAATTGAAFNVCFEFSGDYGSDGGGWSDELNETARTIADVLQKVGFERTGDWTPTFASADMQVQIIDKNLPEEHDTKNSMGCNGGFLFLVYVVQA